MADMPSASDQTYHQFYSEARPAVVPQANVVANKTAINISSPECKQLGTVPVQQFDVSSPELSIPQITLSKPVNSQPQKEQGTEISMTLQCFCTYCLWNASSLLNKMSYFHSILLSKKVHYDMEWRTCGYIQASEFKAAIYEYNTGS